MIRAKIRAAIRKVWSIYAQERIIVMAEAKRYRKRYNQDGSVSKLKNVFYVCAVCNGEHKEKEVQCDHINAIGATPKFPPQEGDSWDTWIDKVFTPKSNLQCICKDCHQAKTNKERADAKVPKLRRIRKTTAPRSNRNSKLVR